MIVLSNLQKEYLLKYNKSDAQYPETTCLPAIFEQQCHSTPDHVAAEFLAEQLTYHELNEKSNKVAHWLILNGALPDQLIGICAERSLDLIVGILGILKSGCAYVPFDASYPADRITCMITESGIKTMLVQEIFGDVFKNKHLTIKAIDNEWNDFELQSSHNPEVNLLPDHLAYVLFTSGSTGMPKGVEMIQKSLMNLIAWHKNDLRLSLPSRTLQFAPISFDVSFQEMFTTWSTGGTLVMVTDEMRLEAIRLLEFIGEHKINRLFLPFIALQHLTEVAENSRIWPEHLLDIITAGEQLQITRHISNFFTKLPGCRLHNHYGPTETHVVTTYTMEGPASSWVPLPPIGKPISNTHIYLLNEDMQPVPFGEEGEIYVGGTALARGYINRPELTKERFVNNPFSTNKNSIIYKTGDLGKYLHDGNIEYNGRADNQVKVRGYRVELGEVEIAIGKISSISQVAVTIREDEPGNKRLVAYLVAEKNYDVSVSDVRKFLALKLPEYMMPAHFVFLKQLPKTPSGKIDRKALPKPDQLRPDIGTLFAGPKLTDEKNMAGIWASLLRIDRIGVNDNFFELGGNSLLALQFLARMRQQHEMDIPIVKMYQHPTIHSLLNALQEKKGERSYFEKAKDRSSKLVSSNNNKVVEDGIAIIGMSGRFPGAANVETMWQNVLQGIESVSFFKIEEIDPFIDPVLTNDPGYVKARGIIEDADKFDASFFGVNPRLAELMDPQQRKFLEVCWEALENAGYTSAGYSGLIGVYAGMGNNTYYQNNVVHHKDAIDKVGAFQVMVANEKDYIATRISHVMNLKGPGLSVHTACSTSLTAVAMACQSLWNNQCDMAIAGGIAITSPVNSGHIYQEGGMFSADGHTRSFDAGATGTVFSDGAGTVILKRYRDAVADGDTVYAIIRGVGINNDGSDKASFTAPSVTGQAQAIAMAQADANVSPETISYVETHGTATPLGDPIEVEALIHAFKSTKIKNNYCAIGSVKSNFGHLTSAAGIAGLIKTTLSLKNKVIPASINYDKPNPGIDFENSPFYVNTKLADWNFADGPRRAGVSSFGVGGTNVHLVLEEAPEQISSGISRSKHLIFISAKGTNQLNTAVVSFKNYLSGHPDINMADAAYTLQTGRASFVERKYVVCESVEDAIKQLEQPNPVRNGSGSIQSVASGVAFMFPGQGSQYVHMGSNLYRDEIVFREAIERCSEILMPLINTDIKLILYPVKGKEADATLLLQDTCYTQPALFTVGYALAKLWMSWGIAPAALIGHSIGEFTAACLAGVFSLEDALMLVARRGQLMQSQPKGSMLSVKLNAEDLQKLLSPDLSIAAMNGPSLCVVSGTDEAIARISILLDGKNVICKKLFTSHAFHSSMMDNIIAPFRKLVAGVKLNAPSIPVVSTATSAFLTDGEATDPGYWSKQLRLPVRFADGIKTLWTAHPDMFLLELGPRNTAAIMAKQQATNLKKQFAVPSLPDTADNDAEWVTILNAIGKLWTAGISINWNAFYALEKRHRIALPTYPFEKKKYWVDPVFFASRINTFQPYLPFESDRHSSMNIEKENLSEFNSTSIMNTISRKDRIVAELRSVMEDASGIELAGVNADASFMELGLDSLFLTQAALTLSKKYSTKITFRQLNESFSSLSALAIHIDKSLPAEAVSNSSSGPVSNPAISGASSGIGSNTASPGTIQWLITQQLQVMQQQLAMVGGLGVPSSVMQVHPIPVNNLIQSPIKANSAEVSENEKAELSKPFGAIARIEKAVSTEMNDAQKKWITDFTKRYNSKTTKSKTYTQHHRSHLADPRVVTGFKPSLKELIYQVIVDRSKGCKLWDIDGNEYMDVLNGFGSNFLGYGSELIMKAVKAQLDSGIEVGPQHPLAGEVAELICEFTGFDRAGFCNTGSEAVLGALRIARTVTGRSTVVCFNGSYHGINDEVIVRGTKKLKSFPASAGIMPEAVQNMLVLDYGTDEALEIIKSRAHEIAAVLVEPIQSRRADFRPKAFLEQIRKITSESGSLLIFDEVITGFRLLPGGAQEFYGIKADIGTYGKIIGGGMPIGAIAGKKEYMDSLDGGFWQFGDSSVPEVGVTYFAGTFVRHPLALAAAKAVLLHLKERGMSIYDKLNGFTDKLVESVNACNAQTGAPYHLVSFGSLFKLKWDIEQPYGELIFLLLRDKGVHIYDGFPCFFTDAFTTKDVDKLISCFIDVTKELQEVGFLSSTHKHELTLNGHKTNGTDNSIPPVAGARLGKDLQGNPGWFVPDTDRPGKYKQVFHA